MSGIAQAGLRAGWVSGRLPCRPSLSAALLRGALPSAACAHDNVSRVLNCGTADGSGLSITTPPQREEFPRIRGGTGTVIFGPLAKASLHAPAAARVGSHKV